MKGKAWTYLICFSIACLVAPAGSSALAPQQLKQMLKQKEKIVIIDIRNNWAYRESHIPGAINIPAPVVQSKRLAPFGRVVVYGDGIRTDLVCKAVQHLNSKKGIEADMLEGGFGAWETLNLPTTHKYGLSQEKPDYISYHNLKKAAETNRDIVLVDLRRKKADDKLQGISAGQKVATLEKLKGKWTDLSEKFPGLKKIRVSQPSGIYHTNQKIPLDELTSGNTEGRRKLYVLVDNGNNISREIAHRLKAAGIKRVVILAGGERSLRREGKAGIKTIKSKSCNADVIP